MLFADVRNSPWCDGFLPRRKEYDVMHSDQQADEQELGPGVLLVLSRNGWEWGDEFVCNSCHGSFPHSRSVSHQIQEWQPLGIHTNGEKWGGCMVTNGGLMVINGDLPSGKLALANWKMTI